jgi:exosortase sorting signal-containing protein
MRRSMLLAASLALASVTAAQKGAAGPLMTRTATGPEATGSFHTITPTIVSQTQNLGSTTLVLDISGEDSWDALNDPSNTLLLIPLGNGSSMTGIGWDVNLATIGDSWLNEARFYFDGSDQDLSGLFLTPGAGNSFPGVANFSSGGPLDLTDNGIPDIPILADGNLWIQLNEGFDDINDAIDANWTAGSELTIVYEGGTPAVPTVGEWGLITLGVVLLGGVVYMTLRRKPAPVLAT